MKLLRLKITDPKGFRSLQAGFEWHFRNEWNLQDEEGVAPFVCAGPNGSGKSNLLEVLAAIFYHLECIYLDNLPDSFRFEEEANPGGFRGERATPDGFEIEYLIHPKDALTTKGHNGQAHVLITKKPSESGKNGESPKWFLLNHEEKEGAVELSVGQTLARQLLPEYLLGYSSGENEILSLPFFKMRFVQFDEYWQALQQQLHYSGRPESSLVYLDSGFSQAILLCNLLYQDADALRPFSDDVKIDKLREFRIIIRRSIEVDEGQIWTFSDQDENKRETIEDIVKNHPALSTIEEGSQTKRYRVNLVQLLEASDTRSAREKIIPRLTRCATCSYFDETSDTLYLDYLVNDATRMAFRENFDFQVNDSPLSLFHAFQVLLTLNLFSASEDLKRDLYQSNSLYASETVPILASDQRIMRFKNFWVTKTDVPEPVLLKSFSDGEHQLLHTLGLCLLFKNTQSLFLLDEPETHFNPDWRANFVTRLHQSFNGSDGQEMLITTHTPFLISDSRPEKVLVFNKRDGAVSVNTPEFNTFGASTSKITSETFDKQETIGAHAESFLEEFRERFDRGEENKELLIAELGHKLGDSIEKVLLIKTILDSMEEGS